MPLAAVPTRCASVRLLILSCRYGMLFGSDYNNMLRDITGVKRGDTVGLCGSAVIRQNGDRGRHHHATIGGVTAMAAIRSASVQRKAAPQRCWLSSAAHMSTASISSGNVHTCTHSFTPLPSRPGGGAILQAFSKSYHVNHAVSMGAQHAHACNAMRHLLWPYSYGNRSLWISDDVVRACQAICLDTTVD